PHEHVRRRRVPLHEPEHPFVPRAGECVAAGAGLRVCRHGAAVYGPGDSPRRSSPAVAPTARAFARPAIARASAFLQGPATQAPRRSLPTVLPIIGGTVSWPSPTSACTAGPRA